MKANQVDSQDSMVGWMRLVSKRIVRLDRAGRLDLLGSIIESDAAGELTVRTMDEIPEGLPVGSPVYVIAEDRVYVQDAATREWQPTS